MHTNVRKFDKDASVFRDWRIDTPEDSLNCIEHDILHWHCSKFIKNPEQLKELTNMVRKYAKELKTTYIMLASRSDFPQVSMLDFSTWARESLIIDNKGATSSYLDIWFINANYDSPDVPGRDAGQLMRYKFIELLVRIAQGKYD